MVISFIALLVIKTGSMAPMCYALRFVRQRSGPEGYSPFILAPLPPDPPLDFEVSSASMRRRCSPWETVQDCGGEDLVTGEDFEGPGRRDR